MILKDAQRSKNIHWSDLPSVVSWRAAPPSRLMTVMNTLLPSGLVTISIPFCWLFGNQGSVCNNVLQTHNQGLCRVRSRLVRHTLRCPCISVVPEAKYEARLRSLKVCEARLRSLKVCWKEPFKGSRPRWKRYWKRTTSSLMANEGSLICPKGKLMIFLQKRDNWIGW